MSLYNHEKRNIVSPESIKLILEEYRRIAKSVNIIIIVGVKPNPLIDTHVWNILKTTKAKIILVGNKNDSEEWIANYRKSNAEALEGYFFENFEKICVFIQENL